MHELGTNPEAVKADPEKLKVLFNEMIQMCLWYARLVLAEYSSYDPHVQPCTLGETLR